MVLLFGMPNMGEILILILLLLLLFGGKKLPELARGLGAGIYEFRRAMNQGANPDAPAEPTERDVTPPDATRKETTPALPEPSKTRQRANRKPKKKATRTKRRG
ncbi:MAG: twin-arginine translocase TatA/TatE family subunit [Turneriella sp.]|nr:twin-arginine translocase TatA/TatE family subunit [Turneriella sp.]